MWQGRSRRADMLAIGMQSTTLPAFKQQILGILHNPATYVLYNSQCTCGGTTHWELEFND
jgi:hypothetical protein